jgi:hypothetical protein
MLVCTLCLDRCHTCRLAGIEPSTRPPSPTIIMRRQAGMCDTCLNKGYKQVLCKTAYRYRMKIAVNHLGVFMIAICKRITSDKGEGPGQTNTNCCLKMLSVNFLIAIYFSHLLVFSYKNLRLCRESLILLEYHKKIGTLCLYQRF